MVGKYPVITLCGSTRFKEQFLEVQKRLTLAGNIVISVGLFGHSGDDEIWVEGTKEMLDETHSSHMGLDNLMEHGMNGAPHGALKLSHPGFVELLNIYY